MAITCCANAISFPNFRVLAAIDFDAPIWTRCDQELCPGLRIAASPRDRRRKAHCNGEARREASTVNGGGWEVEELRKLHRDSGGHRAGGVYHVLHIPGMSM